MLSSKVVFWIFNAGVHWWPVNCTAGLESKGWKVNKWLCAKEFGAENNNEHYHYYHINSILAIIYLNEQVLNKQVLKPD